MSNKRRAPAIKLKIHDIKDGKFVTDSDNSRVLQARTGDQIIRTRLMGEVSNKIIIETDESVILDLTDDTGTIKVKGGGSQWTNQIFMEMKGLKEGVTIDVIGLVRTTKNGEDPYIECELCIPISDPARKVLRELEISKYYLQKGLETEAIEELETAIKGQKDLSKTDDHKDKIVGLLKDPDYLDQGCSFEEIKKILELSTSELEKALRDLQADGEIFEPRPGTFKYV
ncbi:MAG: hypothetical protein GF308_15655 [Candidatus Heimdallarchaeota archaeon]|nr:hypothetical protein [Candidatus Heimdallarchaeota archaeon]